MASLARWTLILLVATSGCSPYRFGPQIGKFADGVTAVSDAVKSGAVSARQEDALRQRIELGDRRGRIGTADCEAVVPTKNPLALPRCRLVPSATLSPDEQLLFKTREGILSDLTRVELGAVQKVGVISDYVDALRAITNAADRAAYDAAASQMTATVKQLASAADVAAPGVSIASAAIVRMGLWLVGEALDADRRAALDSGAHAAASPLAKVAGSLGDDLAAIHRYRQIIIKDTLGDMTDGLTPVIPTNLRTNRLADAQNLTLTQDSLRRAQPTGTVAGLVKSHEALVAALDDPSKNFSDFVIEVGKFADQAKELRTAFASEAHN